MISFLRARSPETPKTTTAAGPAGISAQIIPGPTTEGLISCIYKPFKQSQKSEAILQRDKLAFVGSAVWTDPVVGQILKSSPRRYTIFRVTRRRVINIFAQETFIFSHTSLALTYRTLKFHTAIISRYSNSSNFLLRILICPISSLIIFSTLLLPAASFIKLLSPK